MGKPKTDAGVVAEILQEFYEDLDGNSDFEDDGADKNKTLPPDEEQALALLKDLDYQAQILKDFEALKAGAPGVGADESAGAPDVLVSADGSLGADDADGKKDEKLIEEIYSSECLAAVSAEDAALLSKLALGGRVRFGCCGLRVSYCIACHRHSRSVCVEV